MSPSRPLRCSAQCHEGNVCPHFVKRILTLKHYFWWQLTGGEYRHGGGVSAVVLLMGTMRQPRNRRVVMNPEPLNGKHDWPLTADCWLQSGRLCGLCLLCHRSTSVAGGEGEWIAKHWYGTWLSLSLSDVLLSTLSSMPAVHDVQFLSVVFIITNAN
jgi:hypothetical protein